MFLERPLAMLLGIIVLPLRSLYHGLQYAIAAVLTGIILIFGIPVFFGRMFDRASFPLAITVLMTTLVVAPIITLLILIALAALEVYLVYATVVNMFKVAWFGLKNGFEEGMDGFWRTWSNQRSFLEGLSLRLRSFTNRVPVGSQFNDIHDFNHFELVDVYKENSFSAKKLANEDLEAFDALLKDFALLDMPSPMEIKTRMELLKLRMEQYKELSVRLATVEEALKNGNLEEIEDQLIVYNEIKIPVILMKQYQQSDLNWYSVPANSYVTDKDSLISWLKENPKHPLNSDVIKDPSLYNSMPTRYRWHFLITSYCHTPELSENIIEIRDLLTLLPTQLEVLKQNRTNLGTSALILFSPQPFAKTCQDAIDLELSQEHGAPCFNSGLC